jgi:hypothetical protein
MLAVAVAVIVLCASMLSKRSKKNTSKQHSRSYLQPAPYNINNSNSSIRSRPDERFEETDLCLDDSNARLDDVILTLDSEPLNYTARHQRWLAAVGMMNNERSNDVDSGFTDMMSNSITSYQGYASANTLPCSGQKWVPETSFRTFQFDNDSLQTYPLNSTSSTFLPPPPVFQQQDDLQQQQQQPVRWLQDDELLYNGERWYLDTQPQLEAQCCGQITMSESVTDKEQQRFPPVIRVGSMVHSMSTGSRKSVRFADDCDQLY